MKIGCSCVVKSKTHLTLISTLTQRVPYWLARPDVVFLLDASSEVGLMNNKRRVIFILLFWWSRSMQRSPKWLQKNITHTHVVTQPRKLSCFFVMKLNRAANIQTWCISGHTTCGRVLLVSCWCKLWKEPNKGRMYTVLKRFHVSLLLHCCNSSEIDLPHKLPSVFIKKINCPFMKK